MSLQGRSSHILIGPAKSLPSLLPSLPLPPPPLRSRPPFAARGLGELKRSPSGSGRSPAAKRILGCFELKIEASGNNSFNDFPEK